jgi:hypothetical protein
MRTGIRCYLVAGFVALLATMTARAGGPVVPDWMKVAAGQNLPPYPADTQAVVLLEETTLTVRPEGKSTAHVRRVVKILRQQGRHYGDVAVWFNANSKLNYLHAWSIGPDGHEYAMKDNEFVEHGLSGGGILYDDARVKVAEPPARDVNAVIAYEYEQHVPFYESEDSFDIQESIPKREQRYTLILPAGWEYKTSWHQHSAVEPTVTRDPTTGDHVEWVVRDEPALDMHDILDAPSAKGLRARGVISYFGGGQPRASGDWNAIGAYIQKLDEDRALPAPELTAKAQELVAGKTDFADKVQAIGEFVQQQIRYVAIEIGIGGLQPHNASEIFHYRYGDCKDKATLLAAMLASVGIHSTWVYVDTERGYMTPEAPSFSGNHAIAAIQLPDGYESSKLHSVVTAKSGKRFLIFDPTWEYTPFGVLESNLQGSYGILVDGKDSQLIAFPVLDPSLNLIARTAHFKLAEDGSLKGDVTVRRDGDIAAYWRSVYHEASEKDQRRELERALGSDLGDFTLGPATAENTDALTKEFVQQYEVSVPQYARSEGTLMLVRPRVLGSDSFAIDRKIRTYPVELGETRTVKDDFDVDLPEGYTLDEIPEPVSVDMGFAVYTSRTEMHGNTLHYAREYTVRAVEVPADRYHAVQEMIGQIERDERSQAVFKKKAGPS